MSAVKKPEDVKPADAPKPRMDSELQAMAKIDRILAELSDDAQRRVMMWVVTKRNGASVSVVASLPKELDFGAKGVNGHE